MPLAQILQLENATTINSTDRLIHVTLSLSCHKAADQQPEAYEGNNQGELMMAIESHLATLEKKHGTLEQEISTAMASPAIDNLLLTDLKRKKLQLKEQIEKIKQQVTQH